MIAVLGVRSGSEYLGSELAGGSVSICAQPAIAVMAKSLLTDVQGSDIAVLPCSRPRTMHESVLWGQGILSASDATPMPARIATPEAADNERRLGVALRRLYLLSEYYTIEA